MPTQTVNVSDSGAVGLAKYCPPPEGGRGIPVDLDFTTFTEYDLDLTAIQTSGKITSLEGMWVDNADSANPLQFVVGGSLQRIIIPAHGQGYVMFLAPNPPKLVITQAANAHVAHIILLNFAVMPIVWATQ